MISKKELFKMLDQIKKEDLPFVTVVADGRYDGDYVRLHIAVHSIKIVPSVGKVTRYRDDYSKRFLSAANKLQSWIAQYRKGKSNGN